MFSKLLDRIFLYLIGLLVTFLVSVLILLAALNGLVKTVEKNVAFDYLLNDQQCLHDHLSKLDTSLLICQTAQASWSEWQPVNDDHPLTGAAMKQAQHQLGNISLQAANCLGQQTWENYLAAEPAKVQAGLSALGQCLFIAGRELSYRFTDEDRDLLRKMNALELQATGREDAMQQAKRHYFELDELKGNLEKYGGNYPRAVKNR